MRTSASGTTSNYGGATRLRIPAEGTADNVAESTQDRPAAPVRSGHPRRQHLAHGLNEAARPVQRDQPDQQRRALQFPVDIQRHALRDAARVSGPGWRDVLNPIELRANDVLGDTIQLSDRRESLYWMGADAVTFRGLITNG